jgi:hypothetical protein
MTSHLNNRQALVIKKMWNLFFSYRYRLPIIGSPIPITYFDLFRSQNIKDEWRRASLDSNEDIELLAKLYQTPYDVSLTNSNIRKLNKMYRLYLKLRDV